MSEALFKCAGSHDSEVVALCNEVPAGNFCSGMSHRFSCCEQVNLKIVEACKHYAALAPDRIDHSITSLFTVDTPRSPFDAIPISDRPYRELVTAREVASTYANNELAGDSKFGDQVIQVVGVVSKVERFMGDPIVTLQAGSSGRLFLYFSEIEVPHLTRLSKGNLIIAECGHVRVQPLGGVRMNPCKIPDFNDILSAHPDMFTVDKDGTRVLASALRRRL